MARQKSEFLKSFGTAWEIFQALVNEVLALGGGDEDLRRVLKDSKLRKEIAQLIVKVKQTTFPIWRELQIGGFYRNELMAKLTSAGHHISYLAKDIMEKPAFAVHTSRTIKLVRCTVAELGFTEHPITTELFARIREVGEMLPAEVGPHLRLAYTDQPMNEHNWLMMEPITDSHGDSAMFDVARWYDGGSLLIPRWVRPDSRWSLDYNVVFSAR